MNNEDIALKTISAKTGVDITVLSQLASFASRFGYDKIIELSVEEILEVTESIFEENSELFSKVISNSIIMKIKKILGLQENDEISKNGMNLIFKAIRLYIQGKPMDIINETLAGTNSNFLSEARFFVNKFIPEFSYVCGVFVMIVKAGFLKEGYNENLNKDFTAFASCIKEGTTSYNMLLFKYKHHFMRVSTHRKYHLM